MACVVGKNVVLCLPDQCKIRDRNGKVWTFEFNKFTGPVVLRKDGGPYRRVLGEDSPFYDALTGWIRDGEQVELRDGVPWATWGVGMKGIGLVASLAKAAGGKGRAYAEAYLRMLEEQKDESVEYFRRIVDALPPPEGIMLDIRPSRDEEKKS